MLGRVPSLVDRIYVVDDASPDGTAELVDKNPDPRVRLLRHAENRGVGAAIVTGYAEALANGYDVLVVMAGDDQMDPEDLPSVIAPIVTGEADYVKGNRFRHPERRRMPLLRRIGGIVLSFLTRVTTQLRVDDTQCGYTALGAATARRLPLTELWPRFGYPNDLLGMLAAARGRVAEVVVRPVYAEEQSGLRAYHVLQIAGIILGRWWKARRADAKLKERAFTEQY